MRILSILLTLLIILGGIFLADQMNLWEPESSKIPMKTLSGDYDPGDIRGSYTFGDIEKSFDVTSETLAVAFGIETDSPDTFAIKSLEEIYASVSQIDPNYEIGTSSVRYFVMLFTGIETDTVEISYLPLTATNLLIEEGKITESHPATEYTIDLASVPVIDETSAVEEEEHEEPIINGNTLIIDLLNRGFDENDLMEILGVASLDKGAIVRDVCVSQGLKFSEVKSKIETYAVENNID